MVPLEYNLGEEGGTMSGIKIDYNKLLGYRLLAKDEAAQAALSAKIGSKLGDKVGMKFGVKEGFKFPLSAKIGLENGSKAMTVTS